jgi:spermidine/putrescine transport system substrate-binding protein
MDLERRYRQLLERHGNGDLDRRGFLGNIGRMALACGVVAPTFMTFARSAHAGETIRYDGFGGYAQEAFDRLVLKPFTQKTGITVIQGSYANPDAMLAQIQAEGYDHYNFFTAAQEITPIQIARRGWNAELDESKIPRLKDLIPYVVERNKTHGKGKLLSVPYYLSGGAIAYNTKTIDRAEIEAKGFGILLDTKYKGNMSGFDNWQYRIYYAALQSGQDHNDIQDFDAIWDRVRASKRQVLKYFTSGAEQDALLTSGNVVLTDAWFLSIYNLMKQGQPIDFWPREGGYTQFGTMIALKGCPLDAFYEIIDILLRPEVCFAHSLATGNLPLLDPTKYEFPKELKAMPGYNPTGVATAFRTFDPIYWEANSANWKRDYSRVMARG